MAPYNYQRIQGNGVIRILKLESSKDSQTPLCGSFVLAPLDQKPNFEALSYVWGPTDPPTSFKIFEDKLEVGEKKIGPNLAAALQRLRKPNEPRLIWADAICINQDDDVEKSSQVQMMADVYRAAARTVAWFGPGDREAEGALRGLTIIANSAPEFGFDSPEEAKRSIYMIPVGGSDDIRRMRGDPRAVTAMATEARLELIYSSDWFKRLWITQEAVLSKELVVYLGSEKVPWGVLEVAISLVYRAFRKLVEQGEEVTDLVEKGRYLEIGDVMGLFKERKHQWLFRRPVGTNASIPSFSGFGSSMQFLAMLNPQHIPGPGEPPPAMMFDRAPRYLDTIWDLRYRKCFKDEDRVYATRSLIPWDVPVKVNVDYSKSVVEVYTAFARELLNGRGIRALLLAGIWDRKTLPPTQDADESDEAPSWVCDFRLTKLKRGAGRPWDHPLEEESEIDDFESPEIRWTENPFSRRLHIKVILLDEVEDAAVAPYGVGSDYLQLCHVLYSQLKVFIKAKNLPFVELPSHRNMVTFAEVLGIEGNEYPGAVTRLAQLVIQGRQFEGQLVAGMGHPQWDTGDRFPHSVSDRDEIELTSMIRRLSREGALFRTKRGWIGTGPSMISPKDTVVRVKGLLTLCILRPVEGQDDYQFVGGCYVHDDVGFGRFTMVPLV